MKLCEVKRWGIDIGNVIVKNFSREDRHCVEVLAEDFRSRNPGAAEHELMEALDEPLRKFARLVPDAVRGVKKLVMMTGPENVFVVSRAKGLERVINKRLLELFKVHEETGLLESSVNFVDERFDKARVCKYFGIEGHIDDNGEVLHALTGVVPQIVWFSPTIEDLVKWSPKLPQDVHVVHNWAHFWQRYED